jgi:hypothetical protein
VKIVTRLLSRIAIPVVGARHSLRAGPKPDVTSFQYCGASHFFARRSAPL